jgi:hypothetical protein
LIEIRCWQDFSPPRGLTGHIRRALSVIEPQDLEGIDHVLLLEDVPEISRHDDPELDRALQDDLLLFGAYKSRTNAGPAHIILIVRSLYLPLPGILTHTPAMTIRIAKTIAHEVGHHLIAVKKFALRKKPDSDELETEEEFAERYERSVISRLQREGIYVIGARLLRVAAAMNYYRGARAWNQKNFAQAAHYFDLAIQVEPTHEEANYWFWKAREKAKAMNEEQDGM